MRKITNPELIKKKLEDIAYKKGYNNMNKFYKDIGISPATTWNWMKGHNRKMSFQTQRILEKYISLEGCIE